MVLCLMEILKTYAIMVVLHPLMINDGKSHYDNTDCHKFKQKSFLIKLECTHMNTTVVVSSLRALKRYQECLYMVCVCETQGLFDRKRKAQV